MALDTPFRELELCRAIGTAAGVLPGIQGVYREKLAFQAGRPAPDDLCDRMVDRFLEQILLDALFVVNPALDSDADGVGDRQHLVRPESRRPI